MAVYKDKEIKAITFDLDGTFLLSDGSLGEESKAALEAVIAAGYEVVPASGRPYCAIPEELKKMDGVKYIIASNGASLYDAKTDEKVHGDLLEAKDIKRILSRIGPYFMEGQLTYEAVKDGNIYATPDYIKAPYQWGFAPEMSGYIQSTRTPESYMIDFIFHFANELESIDIVLKEPMLRMMIEKQIGRIEGNFYTTSSHQNRIELSAAGSGKGKALQVAAEKLGISADSFIAFGDGDNDAELLEAAGVGIAVFEATAACKAAADETIGSFKTEAVAKFIKENL